jgi:predicted permease
MGAWSQDLHYAVRLMRKAPVVTAVAVATVALGVGANTALFTVADAVLLKMLPVREPEQLFGLAKSRQDGQPAEDFSYPLYRELRDAGAGTADLIAYAGLSLNLFVGGVTERVPGELVTENYFAVLGVPAAVGRTFSASGDQPEAVAVLSHGFWQRRFGGDPSVVGNTVHVNGRAVTVVGITPAGFHGTERGSSPALRLPVRLQPQVDAQRDLLERPTASWLRVAGRASPGVDQAGVVARLNPTYQRHQRELIAAAGLPTEVRERLLRSGLVGQPMARGESDFTRRLRSPLLVLGGVVGLILLLACANLASLLLGRVGERERELAVRRALGAGRGRLVRQLLTENLLLALAGGALGVVLSLWAGDILLALLPGRATVALTLQTDLRVLGFALAASLVTGLLFGLVPALHASRAELLPPLKEVPPSGRPARPARLLVVGQVAVALVLLVGAGLFARSLRNLVTLDAGFDRHDLVLVSLDLGSSGYRTDQAPAFYRQLLERLRALPGVRSAAASGVVLLGGGGRRSTILVPGYSPQPDEDMNVSENVVTPGYLTTLGIPLFEGRDLTDHDTAGRPRVAVVNEAFARHFFGGESPVGRRFQSGDQAVEIVGVIRDTRYRSLRDAPPRMALYPLAQEPELAMTLHLRTAVDSRAIAAAVRREVADVDAALPVFGVRSYVQQVATSLQNDRMLAILAAFFGGLALLLASIGLYGVVARAVVGRTREIGVRIALGARPGDVLRLVLGDAGRLAVVGAVLGMAVSLATTQVASGLLFGITPTDPETLAGSVAVLGAVTLLAAYLPARRAARIDPMQALRYE